MPFWAALGALAAPLLGGFGSAATGGAKGAEQERMTAADYAVKRDQLGINAARTNEDALRDRALLELQQKKQTLDSGNSAFQNALRSAVVGGFKPAARPRGVSNISFVGTAPQMARPAAEAMDREAMVRLLEGEKYAPLPAYSPYQLNSPAEMQKASTMEKMMGMLGLGGTAVASILNKKKTEAPAEESQW